MSKTGHLTLTEAESKVFSQLRDLTKERKEPLRLSPELINRIDAYWDLPESYDETIRRKMKLSLFKRVLKKMPLIPIPRPRLSTQAQQEYIEQLCIDLEISDRIKRNAHISSILGKDIKYLDELTLQEASHVIEVLKSRKEQ